MDCGVQYIKNWTFEELNYHSWYMEEEGKFIIKLEGVVKGYHFYKVKPEIGETLDVIKEDGNPYDQHAFHVSRGGTILGRVPWLFSKTFRDLIDQGKSIKCCPTEPAQQSPFPWPNPSQKGGGAVIPCSYKLGFYTTRYKAAVDRALLENLLHDHDMFFKLDIEIHVADGNVIVEF